MFLSRINKLYRINQLAHIHIPSLKPTNINNTNNTNNIDEEDHIYEEDYIYDKKYKRLELRCKPYIESFKYTKTAEYYYEKC